MGFGVVVMATDAPAALWPATWPRTSATACYRKRQPITGLADRLIEQRDLIRSVLGEQWWQATLLSAGRLLFDYLCLLFCCRAVGAHPRPSLILLTYAVAGVIGLVPITPGGLGIVEASLSGLAGLGRPDRRRRPFSPPWPTGWPPTGCPLLSGPFAYLRLPAPLPTTRGTTTDVGRAVPFLNGRASERRPSDGGGRR